MKKIKISNLYFICSLILVIIMLLPKEYIYYGYSWTILGYAFLVMIFFITPVLLVINSAYDMKKRNWKLFTIRLVILFFVISIWYLRFYVWNY